MKIHTQELILNLGAHPKFFEYMQTFFCKLESFSVIIKRSGTNVIRLLQP
jgi:hypothetical protein